MNNPDAQLVRRALYERGITLRQWAHEHDYNYSAVQNAVKRHAGGHAREPWGQTTRAILRDLSRTTGIALLPGDQPSRRAA